MTIYCIVEPYMGCVKEFYCRIYTIKLCNKIIHNVRSKIFFVCVQTIYYIKDTIYCFLMTYLLLDAIIFSRYGICLSEDWCLLTRLLVTSPFIFVYWNIAIEMKFGHRGRVWMSWSNSWGADLGCGLCSCKSLGCGI